MSLPRPILCLLLALALAWPLGAGAERSQQFGQLEVHYNAIPTTLLQPEVASAYGLMRSSNRGLLTLSILRDGATIPASTVRATAETLGNVLREISLQEIREGNAVYYVGSFPVARAEVLRFEVHGAAAGTGFDLNFRQSFFADP